MSPGFYAPMPWLSVCDPNVDKVQPANVVAGDRFARQRTSLVRSLVFAFPIVPRNYMRYEVTNSLVPAR